MKAARPYRPNTTQPGTMIVRLVEIRDDEGLDFQEPLTAGWLDAALGKGSPFRAQSDGSLQVHLMKVEDVVHVRGRATVVLGAPCSRCLEPVTLELDTPVQVTMFPRGAEPAASPDGELDADDMGVSSYENEQIDLAGVVHDEVFLELPMNPLCSESCLGLCPTCGQNLNQGACSCEKAVDPRWQALGRIKLN